MSIDDELKMHGEAAANMNCLRLLALLVVAIGLSGCGKSDSGLNSTVQGTVTIDGELAPRGKVSFHNTGSGPSAYGTVHNDGTFTLRVGRGNVDNQDASRIPAGEYLATVVVNAPSVANLERPSGPPLPGVRLTSAQYASKETSGLNYTINAGLNVIDIDVGAPSDEELAAAEAAEKAKAEERAASAAAATEAATKVANGSSDGAENESSSDGAENESNSDSAENESAGTDAANPTAKEPAADSATSQEAPL